MVGYVCRSVVGNERTVVNSVEFFQVVYFLRDTKGFILFESCAR